MTLNKTAYYGLSNICRMPYECTYYVVCHNLKLISLDQIQILIPEKQRMGKWNKGVVLESASFRPWKYRSASLCAERLFAVCSNHGDESGRWWVWDGTLRESLVYKQQEQYNQHPLWRLTQHEHRWEDWETTSETNQNYKPPSNHLSSP